MASTHRAPWSRRFAIAAVLFAFASLAWSLRVQVLPDPAPSAVYRWKSKAVTLPSGHILVAGGYTPILPFGLRASEIYNVQTGFWTPTGNLQGNHASFDMIKLTNGDVLVAGGDGSIPSERFNVATQTWAPTLNQPPGRLLPTLSMLASGEVLMVGGSDITCCWGNSPSTWIYNPIENRWRAGPNSTYARIGHTATTLQNQHILIVGGSQNATPTSPLGMVDYVERIDATGTTLSDAGNLLEARAEHAAVLLNDGKVLVVGGYKYVGTTKRPVLTAEIYDQGSGGWRTAASPAVARMGGHTLTLRWDGTVTLIGGVLPDGTVTDIIEIYNPNTNTWQNAGRLNFPRAYHTATPRPDSATLIDGGSMNGAVPTEIVW